MNEVDLFGEPVTPPHRTDPHTRDGIEDFPLQQDMACWPVVLACQSPRADIEARRWLCGEFDRRAQRAGEHRRVDELARAECLIINNRIVTRHISGRKPEVVRAVASVFTGFRTGLPLTWGEYNSVLVPYYSEKIPPGRDEKMLRIPKPDLRTLLERHPTDARLLKLGTSPPDLGSLAHSPGRPCREHNRDAMHVALQRFLSSDPEDIPEFRDAWVALYLASNQ